MRDPSGSRPADVGSNPARRSAVCPCYIHSDCADGGREVTNVQELQAEVDRLRERKDEAFSERNRVVAAFAAACIALGYAAVVTETHIPGWSLDWNGCVYIQGPTGQVSWHFHDSQRDFFKDLPHVAAHEWDGHTTEMKYERLSHATPGMFRNWSATNAPMEDPK